VAPSSRNGCLAAVEEALADADDGVEPVLSGYLEADLARRLLDRRPGGGEAL
jgi:hypothetical protein